MSSKTKYNGLFHRENKSSLSKTKYPQFDQDIYHSSFDQQYNSNSFGFSGNQNDYDIDHLSSKIKALKDITISIGDEIRESSVFLSSMNDKFSSTRVMLNGIFKNINRVATQQNIGWFHFFLFIFFVCILFWGVWYIKF